MRQAGVVRLTRAERRQLSGWSEGAGVPARLARRARIVLEAAEGRANEGIAERLGTSPGTVGRWRRRFLMARLPGIERDAPRSGRPPVLPSSTIRVIVRTTLERPPPDVPRWSARRLARVVGVGKTTVQRIWKANDIESGRRATPTVAIPVSDFSERVTDFVGLYRFPPEQAMVFAVDERPRGPGGAAPLPSAEDPDQARQRAERFRSFLQAIDRDTPRGLGLRVVVDAPRLLDADEVRRWLVRHPRFTVHRLPPPSGGPGVLDRWVRAFARPPRRREAAPSVARLRHAIRDHLRGEDPDGRPFAWSATRAEILARGAPPAIPSETYGPATEANPHGTDPRGRGVAPSRRAPPRRSRGNRQVAIAD
ncbi:MAG TPA: helix-turn-helix domain-containing protein [Thermoplasmata archaeon]|nr:helix-turn-helix domain-containing protein [Thermoplasmata archaeon]HEV2429611.1 helix-turn-helix domain-containing protein [Thermoplasmata archaeon]